MARKSIKDKKPVTSEVVDGWYKQARKTTADKFHAFVVDVIHGYEHNDSSMTHALAAASMAGLSAGWSLKKSYGADMRDISANFFRQTCRVSGPIHVVAASEMLYPRSEASFAPMLDPSTWQWIQNQAAEEIKLDGAKLVEDTIAGLKKRKKDEVTPEVEANARKRLQFELDIVKRHQQSILDGKVPFGYGVEGKVLCLAKRLAAYAAAVTEAAVEMAKYQRHSDRCANNLIAGGKCNCGLEELRESQDKTISALAEGDEHLVFEITEAATRAEHKRITSYLDAIITGKTTVAEVAKKEGCTEESLSVLVDVRRTQLKEEKKPELTLVTPEDTDRAVEPQTEPGKDTGDTDGRC